MLFPVLTMGSVFIFSRRNQHENEEETTSCENTSLLCRFVLDGTGKKVGETIAVSDDIVIIKSGNKYFGVPVKHLEDDGKTMLVKGLVDYSKAEELGEQWRQKSFRDLNQHSEKDEGKNGGF
ncbi:MAG: DUF5749 family beta-barrel protein [Methanobacteriota archaeon]